MASALDTLPPPAVDPAFRDSDLERSDIVDRFDDRSLDRLPPPVFPPGARRSRPMSARSALQDPPGLEEVEEVIPEEAFISPDAPLRPRVERLDFADDDEVEVTGIGGDPTLDYPLHGPESGIDPSTEQVASILERLSMNLREQGVIALRLEPGLSPFESALRKFLSAYPLHRGDRL